MARGNPGQGVKLYNQRNAKNSDYYAKWRDKLAGKRGTTGVNIIATFIQRNPK